MDQVFLYGKTFANLLGGETSGETLGVDYLSDTIKAALLDSGHTPNRDTQEFFGDVDADEVPATGGYSAGGVTLSGKTITYTAADSWGVSRANTTAYAVGDVVRPATGNGHLYVAVVAGTSDSAPPTFPTVSGQTVADGTVTWAEIGSGITVIDSADPSWGPGATIADIAYMPIYKDTGDPATSPLIATVIFSDGPYSVSNGTFTGQLPSLGWLWFATP